jgi:hypothetical protein
MIGHAWKEHREILKKLRRYGNFAVVFPSENSERFSMF